MSLENTYTVSQARETIKIGSAERNLRGHGKRLRKGACSRDVKKYSFPQMCVDVWNGLEREVVQAGTISIFKAKLDENGWKDKTAQCHN